MTCKTGNIIFLCLFVTSCGSVSVQTVSNPADEARISFAQLVEASPRVREQNILLVITDSAEVDSAQSKHTLVFDGTSDRLFEKTIVLTKSQLDRFQHILPFVIAHRMAHILLAELGISIDRYSLELWSDRLGFQLVARAGGHPGKTIQAVCSFLSKLDLSTAMRISSDALRRAAEPTGAMRCALLRQLYRMNLFDSPIPSTGN